MRRVVIILCVLVFALSNIACAERGNNSKELVSQEAFLKDMASGITKRLDDNRDTANMSDEELEKYFGILVDYELSSIEKYSDIEFGDTAFNELAHRYIEACFAQHSSLDFYKNTGLFNALWTGGTMIRSGIIVFLYENYSLPLSSKQVSNYASNEIVSLTDGFDTGSSENAEVSAAPKMPNQEAPASDFLYVKSSNNEITIRSYNGKDTYVVIPSKIEDCYVTKITEKAFYENDSLVAVSLPLAINEIGAEAFTNCKNLSSVYFPKEQLKSLVIAEKAFYQCNLKGTLVINSLQLYIGNSCFPLNYELEKIYLLSEDIVFSDSPFTYCKSVTDIYMPASASAIYEGHFMNSNYGDVFENMESLERVFMPSSCAFINEETFLGCPKVTVYGKKGAEVIVLASDNNLPVNYTEYDSASKSIIDEIKNLGYSF